MRMQLDHIEAINTTRHDEVTRRTICAILELLKTGETISFYSVAKRAQVARSTLYRRDDLKRIVMEARDSSTPPAAQELEILVKIAELEKELAQVKLERDELEKELRSVSTVGYFLASIESAA